MHRQFSNCLAMMRLLNCKQCEKKFQVCKTRRLRITEFHTEKRKKQRFSHDACAMYGGHEWKCEYYGLQLEGSPG